MEIGKVYRAIPDIEKCSRCGHEKRAKITLFPFNEEYGIFLGYCESGFGRFLLSGKREALMNGGSYEQVHDVDVKFVDEK